jgi:tetratricopeptide (TPR) repeat protein
MMGAQDAAEEAIGVSASELFGRDEVVVPPSWLSLWSRLGAGFAASVGVAWMVAGAQHVPHRTFPASADPGLMSQAVEAYEHGEWNAAVRTFEQILQNAPRHARTLDYLDRIELTMMDAERLRRAEEALVADHPREAERLALSVPPNSPLYAQAEAVSRTARAQTTREASDARAPGLRRSIDVRPALTEALALYQAGRFNEAASRAASLAESAQGDARADLLRWAHDARRFAERFRSLPDDPVNLVRHTSEALEAAQLDDQLSDGYYARKLRSEASEVLYHLARVLLDSGDMVGGCTRLMEARQFAPRDARANTYGRRCESDAQRKVALARSMEGNKPDQSLRLYRQVLAMLPGDHGFVRTARERINALEWSVDEASTQPTR